MSHFSDLLSIYIKESPYNVKNLANEIQMDRTILQKYISGNRFPTSYACIEKIISHLTLTDQQKYDLKKAYKIEKLGLDQYNYLLEIKSIIENIHYIEPLSFTTEYQFDINKSCASNLDDLLIFTQFILNDASTTDHKLQICLPASNKIYELISHTVCLDGHISLEHLLYLDDDISNYKNMYNLTQFENCFPTLLSNKCTIKYIYQHSDSTFNSQNMYPYSIHSQNYTLLINNKLDSGMLLKDEINAYLHTQFQQLFISASLFSSYYYSTSGYLHLQSSFNNEILPFSSLQRKPNILFALDNDILERHCIENKEELLNDLDYYKKHINSILVSNEFHMYFTKGGLLELIQSGVIDDISSSLITPFDSEEIQLLLHRLMNINKHHHNFYLHLIKEEFRFPENCLIAYQEDHEVLFGVEGKKGYHSFILNEPTIKREMFHLSILINIENMVYTEEETLQFIEESILQAQRPRHLNV